MGQAPHGESYNVDGNGMLLIAGAGDFGEIHPAPEKYTTAPGKICQAGDVILAIRATIGEKVLAERRYCLGRGVAGLRARHGLDGRYLWHWLTHVSPDLATKAKGATFKQINREDIGEMRITVPPVTEQKQIAETLDKGGLATGQNDGPPSPNLTLSSNPSSLTCSGIPPRIRRGGRVHHSLRCLRRPRHLLMEIGWSPRIKTLTVMFALFSWQTSEMESTSTSLRGFLQVTLHGGSGART